MRRILAAATIVMALSALLVPAQASAGRVGRYIVVLKDHVTDPAAVAKQHSEQHGAEVGHVYSHALKGYAAAIPEDRLAAVRADARVRAVNIDAPVHAVDHPVGNAPTGVHRAFAPDNAAIDIDGTDDLRVDVDIAIIDTGIDLDHPDLNVSGGKNCSRGTSYDDGNGHGTHVAGSAAGLDNGASVGMAPGARLWAVRVLDHSGSGSWSSVMCGVDWVTGRNKDADTANDIEVANMSLGGGGSEPSAEGCSTGDGLHDAICKSVAAGTTYAVAAGNETDDAANHVPAAYDEVLTVSALADFNGAPGGGAAPTCRSDQDDTFASFSNYGADVDIIAPGVCIYSTWKGGGYNTISGTSMASPHVAGAAALYKSSHATASPADVKAALTSNGNVGWDDRDDPDFPTKEPLLDVGSDAESDAAFAPSFVNAAPTVSMSSPADGSTVSGSTVQVLATATDTDGSVTKVDFYADGSSTAFASDVDGSDGWSATWDLTGVDDGAHTLAAVATDNAGATARATVTVTVDNVADPVTSISLTATGSKVKGVKTVRLEWLDAGGIHVDIYRNNEKLPPELNDGSYSESLGKGGGSYTYKVCETDSATCSNEATVVF